MRIPLSSQSNASDLSDSLLLDNVVIFPDGSVSWVIVSPASPPVTTVACEVVPDWQLLPVEYLRSLQPQPPDIFVTIPEFAPLRALKSAERF